MKRHINIPVFIPHLGCPNLCVFCNQKKISGVSEFKIEDVRRTIDEALGTVGSDTECEIAFFGGSFTGIDRELMVKLLEIANEYLAENKVQSIRCSTRPDYINGEILDILERYGVETVELGLQSASDGVLALSKRGHGFIDEKNACELIVSRGFQLVGQMMIGLPGSTIEDELKTAEFIISSGAVGARIYPTVVFLETELCDMARDGRYKALSLDEAVSRSAAVLKRFYDAGVQVIRVGLCDSENLRSGESYFAGPNHSALGELVESELFYINLRQSLENMKIDSDECLSVFVAKGAVSKAVGHKKINRLRLLSEFGVKNIRFIEDSALHGYDVDVRREERNT